MSNQGASPANQQYLPFDSLSLGEERGKLYQNKDWLYQKYRIENFNSVQIAEILGVGSNTIMHWLRILDIKTRNKSEAQKGIKKSKWVKRICENCGEEFEVQPCRIRGMHKARFCNRTCRYAFMVGRNAAAAKEKIIIYCKICGKKIETHPYRAHIKKFCSQKCMLIWRKVHWQEENNPNYKAALINFYCKNCGKKYKEYKRNKDRTHFCSQKCHGRFRFRTMKSSLNWPPAKSEPEKIFDRNTDKMIKYVGQGQVIIRFKNGKDKYPDFIVEGTNKIIEIFGNYWHRGEDPTALIGQYKAVGYDCLVIWENELKTELERTLLKTRDFLNA